MHHSTLIMLGGPSKKQTQAPAAVPTQGHPRNRNLIVINTSAQSEVPGVGFYPHNSIMTEPFPQPPSSVPPFLHALPALHLNNLPTAPLSSELQSTDSPIDQALNPDLTTYLDTATHHTVNIPNPATSGDLGQTEDVAPPPPPPSTAPPTSGTPWTGRCGSRSRRRGIRVNCTTQRQFSNTSG